MRFGNQLKSIFFYRLSSSCCESVRTFKFIERQNLTTNVRPISFHWLHRIMGHPQRPAECGRGHRDHPNEGLESWFSKFCLVRFENLLKTMYFDWFSSTYCVGVCGTTNSLSDKTWPQMSEPYRFVDSTAPWGIPSGALGAVEVTRAIRMDVWRQDFPKKY